MWSIFFRSRVQLFLRRAKIELLFVSNMVSCNSVMASLIQALVRIHLLHIRLVCTLIWLWGERCIFFWCSNPRLLLALTNQNHSFLNEFLVWIDPSSKNNVLCKSIYNYWSDFKWFNILIYVFPVSLSQRPLLRLYSSVRVKLNACGGVSAS